MLKVIKPDAKVKKALLALVDDLRQRVEGGTISCLGIVTLHRDLSTGTIFHRGDASQPIAGLVLGLERLKLLLLDL